MASSDLPDLITLSRRELYERVWTTPISQLALEFGTSNTTIAKRCRLVGVPCPPRGYWAKKVVGKAAAAPPLPPLKEEKHQTVQFSRMRLLERPPLPLALRNAIDDARSDASTTPVRGKLEKPHPVIRGWLDEHQRGMRESRATDGRMLRPDGFTAVDHRKHRLLDTLFKVLERHGARVRQGASDALFVEVAGERVGFQVRETQTHVWEPLTPDERRWSLPSDKDGLRRKVRPSGRLMFAIQAHLPGRFPCEWRETDTKSLESVLPMIVTTFIAAGPLLREQRLEQEEAERQRRIAEKKARDAQLLQKRDTNRWRRFVSLASRRRDAQLALDLVEAIRDAGLNPGTLVGEQTLGEWLAWAEQQARALDPVAHGAEAIFADIVDVTEWTYRD